MLAITSADGSATHESTTLFVAAVSGTTGGACSIEQAHAAHWHCFDSTVTCRVSSSLEQQQPAASSTIAAATPANAGAQSTIVNVKAKSAPMIRRSSTRRECHRL